VEPKVRVSIPSVGVGLIHFDAPPRNIAGPKLWELVDDALDQLDGDARVVVLASAVDGFFVGHGSLERILDVFEGREVAGDVRAQNRVARKLDQGEMISIAAVEGQAWGGGAELCWSCDLRVASPSASFAQPEVNIGLTPGWGGITKIAHLVGEATALQLALDGRPIGGEEAHRLGLLHRLVPAGSALTDALEWATWLASRPPWALAANKRVAKSIRGLPMRDAFRLEAEMFAECASRPDTLHLIRTAQERYDAGQDSTAAFGLPEEASRRRTSP
jgi:enoyl-CoA hydratase/carnithine racemase